jgi:PAT family beta-lactamase induction signal transducer AmpG
MVDSLVAAIESRRTAAVALLSFSSGLPLGLVWIAIPDWMRDQGVDIRIVGLTTLAQAPWSFKLLWAPLMDRYHPPFWGRRRGWTAVAQVALLALTLGLAGLGQHPESPFVVIAFTFAIAFASASQDIAIDAYAVEVLREDEQGVAVGARIALYRAAMYVAGGAAISLAGWISWPATCVGLALLYLPLLIVTWHAPEPDERPAEPQTLREAVWLPFLEMLSRRRALEILAFVILYKLADNLAQALTRPFLVDMGYDSFDRGIALSTVGLVATLGGTFLGGALSTVIGLGRSLWIFGFLQIFSNAGYILVARSQVDRVLMYGATGFEQLTSGMGTGAFSVLLLRLTRKRFSATQYALFSSLFALPRIVSGPVSGFAVDAFGWETFYWITIACGVPGMLLLARFVPIGSRDLPEEDDTSRVPLAALGTGALLLRGAAGAGITFAIGALGAAALIMLAPHDDDATRTGLGAALLVLAQPEDVNDWLRLAGLATMAVCGGLLAAAGAAARRHGA